MQSLSELARIAETLGGIPILGCSEGSPAAVAGIRYGDVLLAVGGERVSSWEDFVRARERCTDHMLARVFRQGAELEVYVPLTLASAYQVEVQGESVECGRLPSD